MTSVCLVGLVAGGRSGVPRYAAALAGGLDRVAAEFPDLSLRLLTTERGAAAVGAERLEVSVVDRASEGPRRVLGEQLLARRAKADLLHFFDLTGPLLAPRRPFVTTLHDAAIRHGFEGARVAHKRVLQPWALRHASAVVAVSAFAKGEGVTRFGADPARIHVVHSGPGLVAANGAAPARGADGPYLLYVGNVSAHKNLSFLVRAFGAAEGDARLLLVGGRGERYEEVARAVEASPARSRIELRRGASDADVDALYRGATALLLPSRYEGFGFTPLEAMARGCPVLASDIPAIREVSGDGALLLPLDDAGAWADAMRRVVADAALRDDLRRRGAEVVGRYSWEETARGVCRVLLDAGRKR